MLLNQKTAKNVIDHALSRGATFCDIFVEKNINASFQALADKITDIKNGIDFGVGIRLLYGTKVLYGYTNSIKEEDLLSIVNKLSSSNKVEQSKNFGEFTFKEVSNIHNIKMPLSQSDLVDKKIDYLIKANTNILKSSSLITQAKSGLSQREQIVEIFNSHGLHTSDTRHYIRTNSMAIADNKKEQTQGLCSPGAMMGLDFIEKITPEVVANIASSEALNKLGAVNCPPGEMPVIIDNAFGGVIFHEACGHLLETTSVEKKASSFHDKMGEMIAGSCINAFDDGTMPNAWGSINIDDEGMETKKTQLIENGKLTNFLCDYVGHLKTGYECTGSARRESYKYAPASRMRNTFISEGDHTLDQMISSIDKGIYCKNMGGGSVSPGTGEFNFAVREGYLIENGKITKPVKSATLIGAGPSVLKEISMVGKNFEIAAGMCGSVSGSVPASVGQPALKVDNILVGGQA